MHVFDWINAVDGVFRFGWRSWDSAQQRSLVSLDTGGPHLLHAGSAPLYRAGELRPGYTSNLGNTKPYGALTGVVPHRRSQSWRQEGA